MSEQIQKIEKQDIQAPDLQVGGSAIVFQRHEKYSRELGTENAGSLLPEHAEAAKIRDEDFFKDLLNQEAANVGETMFLFVSSDTQYASGGYRSIETAQIAQDAAQDVMKEMGIDPKERIINLNPDFRTESFSPTGQAIRPDKKIREPQIFDKPEYVNYLKDSYGSNDDGSLSQKAWAMHEMDAVKEVREELGAEGVHDILDRTKRSLEIVERYSRIFHANNPDKKLIVWMASHYDTLSPLVKDAQGLSFEEYVPVDYGAGVVIELGKDSEPLLRTHDKQTVLALGKITREN